MRVSYNTLFRMGMLSIILPIVLFIVLLIGIQRKTGKKRLIIYIGIFIADIVLLIYGLGVHRYLYSVVCALIGSVLGVCVGEVMHRGLMPVSCFDKYDLAMYVYQISNSVCWILGGAFCVLMPHFKFFQDWIVAEKDVFLSGAFVCYTICGVLEISLNLWYIAWLKREKRKYLNQSQDRSVN